MEKKSRTGLIGTLAMRVLSISFLFVAIPLLLYTIYLYSSEYNIRLNDVFVEMNMVESAQKENINQMQLYNLSVVALIKELVGEIDKSQDPIPRSKLNEILDGFVQNEGLSALIYVEMNAKGELICKSSTLPFYLGVNFSKYIDVGIIEYEKDNIFIQKDPLFDWSMYVANVILNPNGEIHGVVLAILSLDALLGQLKGFRDLYQHLNLSILDNHSTVLVSTFPDFVGEKYNILKEGESEKDHPGEVLLRPMRTIDIGYKTINADKRHFVLITDLPRTKSYLMITTPSYVVINKILASIVRLAIFLVCILIVGLFSAYLFTRRMSYPMLALNDVMTKVGEGDLDVHYKEDRFGFEINYLGNKFNHMTASLQKYIEDLQVERASKEAFEKELQIGEQIQNAILPNRKGTFPNVEVSALFQGAREVAGDFYDWMDLNDKVMINIADGVGKGVSSCLYSFTLRSMLRSFARSDLSLKEMIKRANKLFCEDTKESCNFVTLFATFFDIKTKILSYSNCGHLPLILLRKNRSIEIFTTSGMALGIDDSFVPEVKEVQLETGDIGILVTDGITEAQDDLGNLYGEKRLLTLLEKTKSTTEDELIGEILLSLESFTKKAPQYDDITLVTFKIVEFKRL